jgi:ATP-binding cassette subfamily A (ABC1) protein 3
LLSRDHPAAGKTTTINMLTGFLEPTAGSAYVEGHSVRSQMQDIYRIMGVCPQVWRHSFLRDYL